MDPRSPILGLFPVWCFFLCELSARFFWRVFCAWWFGGFFCLRQNGNWRQTPWHKLVPFTPGNSSLSDSDLGPNTEDLRKFQLEKVDRENSMIYLNIILFLFIPNLAWGQGSKTIFFLFTLKFKVADHCALNQAERDFWWELSSIQSQYSHACRWI